MKKKLIFWTLVLIGFGLLIVTTILLMFQFMSTNLLSDKTKMVTIIQPYLSAEFKPTNLISRKWMTYVMSLQKRENSAPPAAARLYSYVASVYDDVYQLTKDPIEASVATKAILDVLLPKYINDNQHFYNSLGFGHKTLSTQGKIILDNYILRVQNDGHELVWDRIVPGKNLWLIREDKVDGAAMAGSWKTWIIGEKENFDIPPPPIIGSIQDSLELEQVLYAVANRKPRAYSNVFFWHGTRSFEKGKVADNITPGGVWQNILFAEKAASTNEADYSFAQKILAQSIADAFITAWKVKNSYFTQRPSMRTEDLKLIVADPPFPSYVSGHATISMAAAVTLSVLFPAKETVWIQNAEDASNSRLVAGIHFDIDNQIGKYIGSQVAVAGMEKLFPDKAGTLSKYIVAPPPSGGLLNSWWRLMLLKLQPKVFAFEKKISTLLNIFYRKSFVNVIDNSGISKIGLTTGVSWGDYNGDGNLDALVLGGKAGVKLFKNDGHGKFTDVTEESKLSVGRKAFTYSGLFFDYDNDGCSDIFMVRNTQPNVLYHNNCNGTFTDVTEGSGIMNKGHGRGIAAADYDGDGYLDLYVANYGHMLDSGIEYISEPNIFYHNNGNGTFTDITEKAGVSGATTCDILNSWALHNKVTGGPYKESFQPIWFDYNNDGLPDLFVATDDGISPLYQNNGDGTFTDVTKKAGLCRMGSGMGVTVGDYNNDGNLDIYVTNTGLNYFWRNNGDETFTMTSNDNNTGDVISLGWGAGFFDYDNDGDLDLYTVNGTVSVELAFNPMIGKVRLDKLYKNTGKEFFEEVSSKEGITGDDPKEAAAFGDYNNDGFVDILVASGYLEKIALHRLYKNKGNENHFLTFKLIGTKSNRDAVGSRIILKTSANTQIREVVSGSSYISQDSLWQTFGLGREKVADSVEIRWPSGAVQTLQDIKANQRLTITEGQ